MKCNIKQEFKGYINNVPFDNQYVYYSTEYILNEIEATFDVEVPFTLVRDMKYMLQSAWDNLSNQTLDETEYDFIVCIEGALSIDDLQLDSDYICDELLKPINDKLADWDNTYGKDPIMFDFNNNTL